MNHSTKSKVLYKIITALTLILPVPIYLIAMACIFSVVPDYTINIANTESIVMVTEEESSYLFIPNTEEYSIEGNLNLKTDGAYLAYTESTIIKLNNKGFFVISLSNDGSLVWTNYTNQLFNKQLSYKVPMSILISIVAVVLVATLIFKKMGYAKQHPRTAVALSLASITLILLALETIVSSMLGVFMVSTISWLTYCGEYSWYNRKALTQDKSVKNDELLSSLAKALEGYKQ